MLIHLNCLGAFLSDFTALL